MITPLRSTSFGAFPRCRNRPAVTRVEPPAAGNARHPVYRCARSQFTVSTGGNVNREITIPSSPVPEEPATTRGKKRRQLTPCSQSGSSAGERLLVRPYCAVSELMELLKRVWGATGISVLRSAGAAPATLSTGWASEGQTGGTRRSRRWPSFRRSRRTR